jgi:hypothetical protein
MLMDWSSTSGWFSPLHCGFLKFLIFKKLVVFALKLVQQIAQNFLFKTISSDIQVALGYNTEHFLAAYRSYA